MLMDCRRPRIAPGVDPRYLVVYLVGGPVLLLLTRYLLFTWRACVAILRRAWLCVPVHSSTQLLFRVLAVVFRIDRAPIHL